MGKTDTDLAIRIEQKDFVPWNDSMVGNERLARVSQRVAKAISDGRLTMDEAITAYQRGADLEKFIDLPKQPGGRKPAMDESASGENGRANAGEANAATEAQFD